VLVFFSSSYKRFSEIIISNCHTAVPVMKGLRMYYYLLMDFLYWENRMV